MNISNQCEAGRDATSPHTSSELEVSHSERLTEPVLAAALDDPQTGLLILDAKLRLLHVTSQVRSLLGVSAQERLTDLDLDGLLASSALDSASVISAKKQLAKLSSETASAITLHAAHRERSIQMRVRGISGDYRVVSFNPESGTAEAESSKKDPLTGLASRRSFESAVSETLAANPDAPIAVIFVDLDRFKAVNDTLGHTAGDSLLRLAAERLKASTRKDDFVARLGADQFAVLIRPATTLDEPRAIASRILDLVQRTYLIEGQLVNVGTTMGIAHSSTDGKDATSLLRSAALALYNAKFSGRGSFHFFDAQMERKAQARRTSELELRRALALRQFEAFYQPQVNTKNQPACRIRGAGPLETSRARTDSTGQLSSACGRDRPDYSDRRMDASDRLPRSNQVAGRYHDRGERVAASVRRGRFCKDRAQSSGGIRLTGRETRDRGHRRHPAPER